MDDTLPKRKSPLHYPPSFRHDRSVIIYLTVCTSNRRPVLANDSAFKILLEAWAKARGWLIGRFVIMPDHIHLFCAPESPDIVSLSRWVQYWKAIVSKNWIKPDDKPIWQKSYWDTQLRHGESYRTKWLYVRQNPVRANLCEDPDTWPYQGEINVLRWRE